MLVTNITSGNQITHSYLTCFLCSSPLFFFNALSHCVDTLFVNDMFYKYELDNQCPKKTCSKLLLSQLMMKRRAGSQSTFMLISFLGREHGRESKKVDQDWKW